jgi:hypothetical protein
LRTRHTIDGAGACVLAEIRSRCLAKQSGVGAAREGTRDQRNRERLFGAHAIDEGSFEVGDAAQGPWAALKDHPA